MRGVVRGQGRGGGRGEGGIEEVEMESGCGKSVVRVWGDDVREIAKREKGRGGCVDDGVV